MLVNQFIFFFIYLSCNKILWVGTKGGEYIASLPKVLCKRRLNIHLDDPWYENVKQCLHTHPSLEHTIQNVIYYHVQTNGSTALD